MYTNICIEGIDKSGKGIVAEYVKRLSNHQYTVFDRGVISEITYSKMFGRNQTFDTEPYKRFVFVNLLVDKEDWEIRCKLANEPEIDFYKNSNAFHETVSWFKNNGFYVKEYNTSTMTPFQIACEIIQFMEDINKDNN